MNADAALELTECLQLLAPAARKSKQVRPVIASDLEQPPVVEVDAGLFLIDRQAHAIAMRVCAAGGCPLDLVESVKVWGTHAVVTLVRFNRQRLRLERGQLRVDGTFLQ